MSAPLDLKAIHATLLKHSECMTRDIALDHGLDVVTASNALKMLETRKLAAHRTVPMKLACGRTERRRLFRAINQWPAERAQ